MLHFMLWRKILKLLHRLSPTLFSSNDHTYKVFRAWEGVSRSQHGSLTTKVNSPNWPKNLKNHPITSLSTLTGGPGSCNIGHRPLYFLEASLSKLLGLKRWFSDHKVAPCLQKQPKLVDKCQKWHNFAFCSNGGLNSYCIGTQALYFH